MELSGAWRERRHPWHDVKVVNCGVCGRLLLRQVWHFTDAELGEMASCGPACEELWYRSARARRLAASAS
jgi:hypothetical protein